jgi:hypothetical protein
MLFAWAVPSPSKFIEEQMETIFRIIVWLLYLTAVSGLWYYAFKKKQAKEKYESEKNENYNELIKRGKEYDDSISGAVKTNDKLEKKIIYLNLELGNSRQLIADQESILARHRKENEPDWPMDNYLSRKKEIEKLNPDRPQTIQK